MIPEQLVVILGIAVSLGLRPGAIPRDKRIIRHNGRLRSSREWISGLAHEIGIEQRQT
jgi:hypothetical protein